MSMTRRRFFAPPEALENEIISLSIEEGRHLRDVLRLKNGDEASVFDGQGKEYSCVIIETGTSKIAPRLEVLEKVSPPAPESPLDLALAIALLKGEKLDMVVQKATELGVNRIIPIATALSDVRIPSGSDLTRRVIRWQRLALEACKQSGRARVPEIEQPIDFVTLVETEKSKSTRVMFAERMGLGLDEALVVDKIESLTAVVGPEGGWNDDEIEMAKAAGWKVITLGGRIMRAETAAIAISVLLQNRFGDLK
jgi:16S rRNA (uracil1498-N3)-methyltransferase